MIQPIAFRRAAVLFALVAFATPSLADGQDNNRASSRVRFDDPGIEVMFPVPVQKMESSASISLGTHLFAVKLEDSIDYKSKEDFYLRSAASAKDVIGMLSRDFPIDQRLLRDQKLTVGEHPAYEWHVFETDEFTSSYAVHRMILVGNSLIYMDYFVTGGRGRVALDDQHAQRFFHTLTVDPKVLPHRFHAVAKDSAVVTRESNDGGTDGKNPKPGHTAHRVNVPEEVKRSAKEVYDSAMRVAATTQVAIELRDQMNLCTAEVDRCRQALRDQFLTMDLGGERTQGIQRHLESQLGKAEKQAKEAHQALIRNLTEKAWAGLSEEQQELCARAMPEFASVGRAAASLKKKKPSDNDVNSK